MPLNKWVNKVLAAEAHAPDEGGTVISEWYDDAHTAILQRYTGKWRCRDACFDLIAIKTRIDDSPHPVDIIFDLRASVRLPFTFWMLLRIPHFLYRHRWPINTHRVVVVGGGSQARDLKFVRSRLAPGTMKFFRWVEKLEEVDGLLKTWKLFEDERTDAMI